MLSSPAGLYLVLPMFAFTSGLLQRGYPSISPHREQKFTIALSSSHQQLVGWDPAGVPPPLPKLQVDPARVEAASSTLCLLRQHIGTVASHQLAAPRPNPSQLSPGAAFKMQPQRWGRSGQPAAVPRAAPRRHLGKGWGARQPHLCKTQVCSGRYAHGGPYEAWISPHRLAALCHRALSSAKRSGTCAERSGSGERAGHPSGTACS